MNVLLFLFFAVVALAERAPALRFAPRRLLRPFVGTDLVCLVTGALGLGLLARVAATHLAEPAAPVRELAVLPPIVTYALGLVLYDLSAYLTHSLLLHRVPWLWRVHAVHHSSLELDWLATFRAHVIEHALRHLTSGFALVVVGFPVEVVGAVAATYAACASFGHANLKLPLRRIESVLVTPRLHRLHHGVYTCDRNFGTVFTLWDRLFGTLILDTDEPTQPLGVPGAIEAYPQTWLRQLVAPFRPVEMRPVESRESPATT